MCQKLGLERKGLMHIDQKTRFSVRGRPVYHYCAVSSFSEYTVVHSGCAVKIGTAVPMDRVCLLSCGVSAGKLYRIFFSVICVLPSEAIIFPANGSFDLEFIYSS
jgi:hypothetical protein